MICDITNGWVEVNPGANFNMCDVETLYTETELYKYEEETLVRVEGGTSAS